MKIAFMFPGQGAQYVGMGREIYNNEPVAKGIYGKASKILEMDMCKLCFETEQEILNKTENAQIAISVTSFALAEVLKQKGIKPNCSLGLSLGEYTSLIYSGFLSMEEGLKLLKLRGNLMATLIPKEEYSMLAVIGLESKKIEEICKKVTNKSSGNKKIVCPSNYNYSMQTVISGNSELVKEAGEILKLNGARKVVELKTSGPFHTKKLIRASKKLRNQLDLVNWTQGEIPVIKNLDGNEYDSIKEIPEILEKHMICPVRFDKQIEKMIERGIDTFIEIGPRKNIKWFCKKRTKNRKYLSYRNK